MFETLLMFSTMTIPTTRKIMFTVSVELAELDEKERLSLCSPLTVSPLSPALVCTETNPSNRCQASPGPRFHLARVQAEHRPPSRRDGSILWWWRRPWLRRPRWLSWPRRRWWLHLVQLRSSRTKPLVNVPSVHLLALAYPWRLVLS